MTTDLTTFHVRRAVQGDRAATDWLVSHFHSFVEAQVRLRLRGRGTGHDVEDLVADVWAVALEKVGELEPRDGRHAPVLVRFLGTTALQTCNNFLRTRARIARVSEEPDRDPSSPSAQPVERLAAQTRGALTRVAEAELCSLVRRCLDRLKGDQRDVLVLRLMEHTSNKEIARVLQIPANTIAVRYRRALEALRAALPAEVWTEVRSATNLPKSDKPC